MTLRQGDLELHASTQPKMCSLAPLFCLDLGQAAIGLESQALGKVSWLSD